MWDAASGGNQQPQPYPWTVSRYGVLVVNGIFTVQNIDFTASAFSGADRWLEISVRVSNYPIVIDPTPFSTLSPRQRIGSTPYAIRSLSAATADNVSGIVSVANGGTGGATQNFVDLTNAQTIDGNKTFSNTLSGNAVNSATQFNIGGERVLSAPGTANVFAGLSAGRSITTGYGNSFLGSNAGVSNTTGFWNSFFGDSSGSLNGTANVNSFFGKASGGNNSTGGGNTFVGALSGLYNTDENFNTLIGYEAEDITGVTNATALGAQSQVTRSNSLVLGSVSGVNNAHYDTNVGIGTTAPAFKLQIIDSSNTGLRVQTNTAGGTVASFGGLGSFQIDGNGAVGGRFIITEAGNVGINTNNPLNALDVAGVIAVGSLGPAGSTTLCRNASNQISTCSSSLRYKTDIQPFSNGLNFINRLRPIAFSWKDGGMKDVGFGAEDVEKISPLLVTYNSTGQVEGVKYDRFSVLFVNAIKEQQTQIAEQHKLIDKQQAQIDLLKRALCHRNHNEAVCKR